MPSPTKIDFPEAMRAVINGKRVSRLEWTKGHQCFLDRSFIVVITPSGHQADIDFSGLDILATDWIILEDS